jgi:hypothetical protein
MSGGGVRAHYVAVARDAPDIQTALPSDRADYHLNF